MDRSGDQASGVLLAHASRGVAWTLVTSSGALAMSLITQIILGWLLIDSEFGIYAIAIAFVDFLRVFRDGGAGLWLARLTPDEYRSSAGSAFWLSLICSVVAAALLMIIAFPLGAIYHQPQVTHLILILAASFPLGAYTTVAAPLLQVRLQFRTTAVLRLVLPAARYSLIVIFAWFDFGAYSFAWPIPIVTTLELMCYFALTRLRFWSLPFSITECRRFLARSGWSMAGSFATAVLRQIDYAIFGLIASAAVVGVYFFAYQLTMQPVLLFSESIRRVVLPVFRRMDHQVDRQQRGLVLSGSFLGMVAGPVMYLLAVVAPDIETLLWHGRWAHAVPTIRVLALAMPIHLAAFFVEMLCQSRGQFRLWTSIVMLRGLGLGAAAWLGGVVGRGESPTAVAASVAVYLAASGTVQIAFVLGQLQLGVRPFLLRLLPPLFCGALVAAAVMRFNVVPSTLALHPLLHGTIAGSLFLIGLALLLWLLFREAASDVWFLTRRTLNPRA